MNFLRLLTTFPHGGKCLHIQRTNTKNAFQLTKAVFVNSFYVSKGSFNYPTHFYVQMNLSEISSIMAWTMLTD